MKLRNGFYLDSDKDLAFKKNGKWYFWAYYSGSFTKACYQKDWEQCMQETGIYLFGLDLSA